MEYLLPERVAAKLGPLGRYEVRVLLLALALALVGIPFGLLLHQVVTDGPLTAFDEDGAQWLNDRVHDHGAVIAVLHGISFLGKPIFLLFAVGLPACWLVRHGAWKLAVFLGVTCLGAGWSTPS